MTKDVNAIVLDAFRIEHREQLEQMRTLLESLRPGDEVANDSRVADAFRLAHSFKGGARVCDLREAERLGHALEAVLERLKNGELRVTEDVLATVHLVLDRIEDWMAALDGEQPPPNVSDVLSAIDHMLQDGPDPASSKSVPAKKAEMLRSVFREEQEQHTARLWQFLTRWSASDGVVDGEELIEAARIAHTLAGAAAVVEMHSIELAAENLEQLFRTTRASRDRLDVAAQRLIEEWLDTISETARDLDGNLEITHQNIAENHVGSPPVNPRPGDGGHAGETPAQSEHEPAVTAAATVYDTVRVSVDSLDRLVRSSSAMLAENQHVARHTRQLAVLQREVSALEREREAFRRAALASLHQLAAMPEFDRVSQYMEFVDRQVNRLAQQTRQLAVEQRRIAWQLRARSSQVQRDVHEARLVPAHSVFQGFRKMVRDLAKSQGKEIEFQSHGMEIRADRMVLQELKNPIMHVLRNCVSHGIESPQQRRELAKPAHGHVSIRLETAAGRLNVVIEDDGRGIDVEHVRRHAVRRGLLSEAAAGHQSTEEVLSSVFEPGFSTAESVTELAGRGMGLSIVHDSVTRLQGHTNLLPRPDGGVRATLSVPVFVSTHRVLLVTCGKQTIAIPTHGIERLLRIPKDKVESMEGQPVVTYDRRPIRLMQLSEVLDHVDSPAGNGPANVMPVVLLKSGTRLLAVGVDALLEERDALILNLDEFAEDRQLAGGILQDDGEVALVVQPVVLMDNAHRTRPSHAPFPAASHVRVEPERILIVDDSFTTRTLEKSILESQGYEVRVAIDGVEALSLMRQQRFALVISDIEMPRMDGFALLEHTKADRRLANIPVILVTSRDRREDQQRGLDLGAEAYVVKRKFDHQELLNTIRQLL